MSCLHAADIQYIKSKDKLVPVLNQAQCHEVYGRDAVELNTFSTSVPDVWVVTFKRRQLYKHRNSQRGCIKPHSRRGSCGEKRRHRLMPKWQLQGQIVSNQEERQQSSLWYLLLISLCSENPTYSRTFNFPLKLLKCKVILVNKLIRILELFSKLRAINTQRCFFNSIFRSGDCP